MRFTAGEIAAAVAGVVHGPDVAIDGVATDSRELTAGSLFVPIVAARDGHDFIADALAGGAIAYLTARAPGPGTAIVVDDTMRALTVLGRHARDRLPDHVVGVTGSVGKTSVKDLIAAVLAQHGRVGAAHKSFNNEIGVPVTLANSPHDAWACVIEMGARGIGHVAELCAIARPTVGVVTAVVAAHTEQFGSLDDVARAKAELVQSLPHDGTAVLNANDARVVAMAAHTTAHRVLTYGVEHGDVAACDVHLDDRLRASFVLRTPAGSTSVTLGVSGGHMAANAAGAAAVALALGLTLDHIAAGLAAARLSPQRMDVRALPSGALVIDDAYNANPTSVIAAMRALDALPGAGRRIAVLGVMAELGPDEANHHREIAVLAADLGIEIISVGAPLYEARRAFEDVESARTALGPLVAGDAVLVKGSRVAQLERLVELLLRDA